MNKLEILINNNDLLDVKKFSEYLLLLKEKELETYRHSIRVSKYSTEIAKEMGFGNNIIVAVWLSGLLHDLGKLDIPNNILLGRNKLSESDYRLVRKHPLYGLDYLKEFTSKRVYMGAIEHHERLDGSGYPYGVKYISTIGKIIAIADTFDAMTSNRTYQIPLSYDEALIKIEELVNRNFYDEQIFLYFKKVVNNLKNIKRDR